MHYKDDHIKDVQSTCRGSCNTRMECWWLSTSSTLGSFSYSTSLSALCTQWGKTKHFCPPLPSCCAPLVPTDTSQKQKPPLSLVHGYFPPGARNLSAWQQSVCLSVCLSILPSALQVCSFCDGVFYSALPLYMSTVAPGQSLGIGIMGFKGVSQTHCSPGWLAFRVCVNECVGGVVSFLAVQVTTLTKHVRYKALIETSTAVATVRVQLHSPCLMSSRQLQFGIKCAVIVLLLRAECK